jgi:hypothetical protein
VTRELVVMGGPRRGLNAPSRELVDIDASVGLHNNHVTGLKHVSV